MPLNKWKRQKGGRRFLILQFGDNLFFFSLFFQEIEIHRKETIHKKVFRCGWLKEQRNDFSFGTGTSSSSVSQFKRNHKKHPCPHIYPWPVVPPCTVAVAMPHWCGLKRFTLWSLTKRKKKCFAIIKADSEKQCNIFNHTAKQPFPTYWLYFKTFFWNGQTAKCGTVSPLVMLAVIMRWVSPIPSKVVPLGWGAVSGVVTSK